MPGDDIVTEKHKSNLNDEDDDINNASIGLTGFTDILYH